MTTVIDNLYVIRDTDESYLVRDAEYRSLGGVVRVTHQDGHRSFYAFGEHFPTLGCAISEFRKIRWVKPIAH